MSHIKMVVGPKAHPHSVWLYWGVFAALVALTAATVWLAQYDFGSLNLIVTLLIAGTKASLVLSVFMHLAYDSKFYAVVASSALVFLLLFLAFPLIDFDSRADLDASQANFLPRDERVYEHHLAKPEEPLGPGLSERNKEQLIFLSPTDH